MSYDYEKTSLTLCRVIFRANYDDDVGRYLHPDKELVEAAKVAPLLHPTSDSPNAPDVPIRAPNTVIGRDGLYAPDIGGALVFDRAGVLYRAGGDFAIPGGTDIPPNLKMKQDSRSKRLQATYYTIMSAKPMYREILVGQLDNFMRNAIRHQWEKACGLQEWTMDLKSQTLMVAIQCVATRTREFDAQSQNDDPQNAAELEQLLVGCDLAADDLKSVCEQALGQYSGLPSYDRLIEEPVF